MRVNTGTARGMALETLPGEDIVRPTSQKAKEAIFSALQFQIPGTTMLDLFAGSGQMGIEALSRGASHCVFVDNSRDAIGVIKRNLNRTGLFKSASVAETDALRYIQRNRNRFGFIYADPPYRKNIAGGLVQYLGRMLDEGGFAAVEAEKGAVLPEESDELILKKRYDYGNTSIWLYARKEDMDR
ncbi:MAG: 16S rRNA (guanine(966)-N(2))-methyltransferase RsmD [Oscillospiraceae bacterium]|nr:16S rRNA (guanine(966)-N(2))-methyltransferase RsmD [Oscillospiraceae bacterium]MBR5045095.1 16S rRNA (guanine(966)-N(2))-methyltransferase RsmD [Oscillospiraceae bacterium]MBR5071187.1 16S rRNA (guanine(966)-N(2))-methyltransferase RsmD [Oscillospiraceae bacterium]MBR5979310.1 16S rRNA (guanine(966)-N(2))-methyltransferase RsmD [Oscillospiraceae bacterium]